MTIHQYFAWKWQLAVVEAKLAGVLLLVILCSYLLYKLWKLVRRG